MNTFIPFEAISLEQLTNALQAAVIDFLPHTDDTIYVTGLAFPAFWKIDLERALLTFSTYLDVSDAAREAELLDFANTCNRRFILAQFSFHPDVRRFYGHYALSIKEGMLPRQDIRTGKLFAFIFEEAAKDGTENGLLVPLEAND